MPNGTVFHLKKGRLTLKSGVVPTIFPNCPKYLTKIEKKRKGPLERTLPTKPPKNIKCSHTDGTSNENDVIGELDMGEIPQINEVEQPSIDINKNIFDNLKANIHSLSLPSEYWFINVVNNIICSCWEEDLSSISRKIIINEEMQSKIFADGKTINVSNIGDIKNAHDVLHALNVLSSLITCWGTNQGRAKDCIGYVLPKDSHQRGPSKTVCGKCKQICKKNYKAIKLLQECKLQEKYICSKHSRRNYLRKNQRLHKRVNRLKEQMENLRKKCAASKQDAVKELMDNLPDNQKLAVEACIAASKAKSTKGMRYTSKWVLECLLLRIKSSKTYEHIRKHKILTLPCIQTLNR